MNEPDWSQTEAARLLIKMLVKDGETVSDALWITAGGSGHDNRLRDALLAHHPIMRSETGPFSGCQCGQVKLGQDVIAHVVSHLRAALHTTTDQP